MASDAAGQSDTPDSLVEKFATLYARYYDSRDGGDGRLDEFALAYADRTRFYVDYDDLATFDISLVDDLRESPRRVIEAAETALRKYDLPQTEFADDVSVGIDGVETMPEADHYDVGGFPERDYELVVLDGQVSKVAKPRGRVITTPWECQRCGTLTVIEGGTTPHECQGCERQGPFEVDWHHDDLERGSAQRVRLQQPPETANGGDARDMDVRLTGDDCERVTPGDRVSVAAILIPEIVEDADEGDGSELVYDHWGDVVGIAKRDTDFDDLEYEEYMDEIEAIAASENIHQRIVDSIKPTHYGDVEIKEALALQMFGGVTDDLPDGSTKRGQIHVLLSGDPGLDKSGLIHYATRLAPRSVYTVGNASTSAGLTAAAVQTDFGGGGWTLEPGALVKAHRGLCGIDEFDKMDDDEIEGVNEALSEGTVSPSKAGMSDITLPAQTTVLAAANPEQGRFDQYQPIGDQIGMPPALLSRFDLLFTMTDKPDPESDAAKAEHVIDSAIAAEKHAATGEIPDEYAENVEPDIPVDVLRHYIAYAKDTVEPELTDEARQKFTGFYVDIRSEGIDEDSPVPLTVRKLNALVRLGEAAARMRLSETIEPQDADLVIEIVTNCLKDVGVDPETGEFDADMVEASTSKTQRDRIQQLKDIVDELEMEYDEGAPTSKVIEVAVSNGMTKQKVNKEIENLKGKGELYEPSKDYLRTT